MNTSLTRFLGWFSLGLGAAELLVPARITRFLGTRNRTTLVRTAYGLREVAAGAGLLRGDPKPWIFARLGGDALDLATLGVAMKGINTRHRNVAIALASVVGVTILDVIAARQLTA